VKAEEGVMEGAVLFHKFVSKTPEEKEIADKKAAERKAQREKNEKLAVKKLAQKAELKKIRKAKEQKKLERNMPDLSDDEGKGDREERRNRSLFQQEWDGKEDKEGVEVRPAKKERYNPLYRKKKGKDAAADAGGGKTKRGKGEEKITKWNEKKTIKSGQKKKLKLKHKKK